MNPTVGLGRGLALALLAVGGACADPTRAQVPPPVDFETCSSPRGQAFCGLVEVPEDHGDPGSRRIGLRVQILPAAGQGASGPPIFFLAGGPGQAASDVVALVADRFGSVLAERDFVFVDQRGTGGSNPLSCATDVPNDPRRLFGPHYAEEEIDRCLSELAVRADVELYTTTQFAHDLDTVAERLGYEQIDVMGGSYGTKAGLVLMRAHPERIRVAVLEGVAPPSFLNPLPHAQGNQYVLDRLLRECAEDDLCAGAFPDLESRYPALLERLEADPAEVRVPGSDAVVSLERETMAYLTHLLLFNQQSSTLVPAFIHQVDGGEYGLLTTVARQIVDGLVAGIHYGLQLSVTCTENVPMFRGSEVDAATSGTYLGRSMVDGMVEQCTRWRAGEVPAGFYDSVTVSVPTLLITGGMDPATPPSFGDEVARSLSDARLFRVDKGAHITPHPCVNGLIVVFLIEGSHENLDGGCLASIRRPPFQIPGS